MMFRHNGEIKIDTMLSKFVYAMFYDYIIF